MTGNLQSLIKTEKIYISLAESFAFFKKNKSILFSSFLIIAITFGVSLIAQSLVGDLVAHSGFFLFNKPAPSSELIGQIWSILWAFFHGLYIVFIKLTVFYITFFVAYTFSSPLYSLISKMTEKIFKDSEIIDDTNFTFEQIVNDILEAFKLTLFITMVSLMLFFVNALPFLGTVVSFFVLVMVNALIFIDFAASRKGWALKNKISWLLKNKNIAFKTGFLPALISLVPIFNIFFLVFIYPLFTVYGTLNFVLIEEKSKLKEEKA